MRRRSLIIRIGVVVMAATALVACSGSKEPEEPEPPDPNEPVAARVVGEIVSVHPTEDGSFVLIKRLGRGRFGPEMLYSSVNEAGATASLRPTGETLGRFHAADVLEGEPKTGELVISRRMPREGRPEMIPVPETNENQAIPGWSGAPSIP